MLETAAGNQIPELALHPGLFLDKTTVLYGPSKTGKTVLVKTIMGQLNGHIDQILVIAPTEPTNRSYDGFVDPSLIHYSMSIPDPSDPKDTEAKAALRFLTTIYERQDMMASIYTRANNPEVLKTLYAKLSHAERKKGDGYIASLERKRRRVIDSVQRQHAKDPGRCEEKENEVNDKFKKMLVLLYKKFLTPAIDRLWKVKDKMTEDELWSLNYLHFNPRLLLIFDDCAAQLKPFFSKEIFRKLFYQNRHSFISVVICCQDDTDLPTNLRKNAFTSIFTTDIVASSNFERATNKFSKATKTYVTDVLPDVFQGHRKLVYIREDDKRQNFYHLTCASPRRSMFGSQALIELCQNVHSEGVTMDTKNRFYDRFKVS